MAVILSDLQLAKLRQAAAQYTDSPADYEKDIVNAAFQALEDWYEAEKPVVSGIIDSATAPFDDYAFTNAEKKILAEVYLILKSQMELS